ncbi:MAG: septum formation inhibitor Maf [Candidatus Methylopumilus sp.]|nr:septum formation inhibitor Maf [Candidatus Methylopumilus sp.]NBW60565.1 septum formation inhibitor Maf [Methylophilaceae bacterium]
MTMLYLASKSPRRAEILKQLGVPFQVLQVDVDETPMPHEDALEYVQRIAKTKAEAGWHLMQQQQLTVLPLLSADTTVSLAGEILGKPVDQADALRMLQQLSGSVHEVHTALAMMTAQGLYTALSSTRVMMKPLSESELHSYISSGEPMDKAGAYGIQGLASLFVQRIEGSYSGVMGLPIYETGELCRQAGINILALQN